MIKVEIKGQILEFHDSEKELEFSEFCKKHKHDNYSPCGKDEVWKAITGKKSLKNKKVV